MARHITIYLSQHGQLVAIDETTRRFLVYLRPLNMSDWGIAEEGLRKLTEVYPHAIVHTHRVALLDVGDLYVDDEVYIE